MTSDLSVKPQLNELFQLLLHGTFQDVKAAMEKVLHDHEDSWSPDEIGTLTILFRGLFNKLGIQTSSIYSSYEKIMKDPDASIPVLRTLSVRCQIVELYEGLDGALAFLTTLSDRVPAPDDGILFLTRGKMHLERGNLDSARKQLFIAVSRSLSGIEWYRVEAFGLFANCLIQLGEYRLAFEYVRTQSIEQFKLGQLNKNTLFQALFGLSLLFGQIDYKISIHKNLSNGFRNARKFSRAAVEESTIALHLAQLGILDEAIPRLLQAAQDAARGKFHSDPHFSVICQLLRRYLNRASLDCVEMLKYLKLARKWGPSKLSHIADSAEMHVTCNDKTKTLILGSWKEAFAAYHAEHSTTNLVLMELLALLARYYSDIGDKLFSTMLYEIFLSPGATSSDAIFDFAFDSYIRLLIEGGRGRDAAQLAETRLAQEEAGSRAAHEIFAIRRLAAEARICEGNRKMAYQHAMAGLQEWRLVLNGLYEETHKIAWIERGLPLINIAMEALLVPADWISESDRKKVLFALVELGKARLVADNVMRQVMLPGAYLLPGEHSRERLGNLLSDIADQHPEWYPPLLLQTAVFGDALYVVRHDEYSPDSFEQEQLEIEALRGAILLPLSKQARLLAAVDSVGFNNDDQRKNEFASILLQRIFDSGNGI